MPTFVTEDTILCISSCNSYNIDFSNMNHLDRDHPLEWRKEEIVYGYFKYKNFDFFCYTSSMKYTDLFYETTDSVKVKNSPLLYVEYEPEVDDSRTQWFYIYKNKQLIKDSKTTCDAIFRQKNSQKGLLMHILPPVNFAKYLFNRSTDSFWNIRTV